MMEIVTYCISIISMISSESFYTSTTK